jgi:hypothetical protein
MDVDLFGTTLAEVCAEGSPCRPVGSFAGVESQVVRKVRE